MATSSRAIDHTCDPVVRDVYEHNANYRVRDINPRSKTCIVFFSGNGLYFPNEEAEFTEKVVRRDRYEWERIASGHTFGENTGRIIFVRDVFKQCYVEGINSTLCNVDKVGELLHELTAGFEIITVGNSAGGYAATLFGCILGAKRIVSISGQFFFPEERIRQEPLLEKRQNDETYSKYYDLSHLLRKYRGTLFYIHSSRAPQDIPQTRYVADLGSANIFPIAVDSDGHGVGLFPEHYAHFLFQDAEEIKTRLVSGKTYSQISLFFRTVKATRKENARVLKRWARALAIAAIRRLGILSITQTAYRTILNAVRR